MKLANHTPLCCPLSLLQVLHRVHRRCNFARGVVADMDGYFTCVEYRHVGIVIMRHVWFTCRHVNILHVDMLAGI